jgi:hypothetical protein
VDIDMTIKQRAEILNLLPFHAYVEDYWSVHEDSLNRAFSLMLSEEQLPCDFPMQYSVFFETNRNALILAAFGNSVPSFNCPGGKKVQLLRATPRDTSKVTVACVPLRTAIRDFEEFLDTGLVYNVLNQRKSTPYQLRMISYGGDAWNQLMKVLRAHLNEEIIVQEEKVASNPEESGLDFEF